MFLFIQEILISLKLLTEEYVSRTSTSPDTYTIPMQSQRCLSTSSITVRAKAAGGTNTVDLFIGLHTYPY